MSDDVLSDKPQALFTIDELAELDRQSVPRHVAIVPDGNRRWAMKHKALPQDGHRRGSEVVTQTLKAAAQLGVQVVTFYTFSTENWNRTTEEVEFLMALLEASLSDLEADMLANGVRFNTIGDLSGLPRRLVTKIEETKANTSRGQGVQLVLALNYGGRDEMRRAIIKILQDYKQGKITESDIDDVKIASYLDTAPWGDPELLIRTSGEHRFSNFLLWQLAYTEFYFTDVLWPDFSPKDLLAAVLDYQQRTKRLGT